MEPQTTCKNNPDPKEIILNSFSKVFGDSNGIRVFFAPGSTRKPHARQGSLQPGGILDD